MTVRESAAGVGVPAFSRLRRALPVVFGNPPGLPGGSFGSSVHPPAAPSLPDAPGTHDVTTTEESRFYRCHFPQERDKERRVVIRCSWKAGGGLAGCLRRARPALVA